MSKIGTFNYPGGKTNIAGWIIDYIPDHEVYVEPFGGAAGVLANKPPSPLEVYNDTEQFCVDFFRALKRHPDELQAWAETTPYSRALFEEYVERLQSDPPEDLVERAGMFWYTQFLSFGGKGVLNTDHPYPSMATQGDHGRTGILRSAAGNLDAVADRFRDVQLECLDYEAIFEKYDSAETVFYCDPPYVDKDQYYMVEAGGFDHGRFVSALHDLDGRWIVSYDHNVPSGLAEYATVSRSKHSTMDLKKAEKTETLVMNFDADGEPVMSGLGQQALGDFS